MKLAARNLIERRQARLRGARAARTLAGLVILSAAACRRDGAASLDGAVGTGGNGGAPGTGQEGGSAGGAAGDPGSGGAGSDTGDDGGSGGTIDA